MRLLVVQILPRDSKVLMNPIIAYNLNLETKPPNRKQASLTAAKIMY